MFAKLANTTVRFLDWADEKLDDPNYLKGLLGFWVVIFLFGAFLVVASFYRYSDMVLAIGLTDMFLAIAFGVYYAMETMDRSKEKQSDDDF